MQMDERRSKGGFLQFFDWNSKSRKKLFSNGNDVPGGAKQGMEDSELLAKSRITNTADVSGSSPGNKGSNDWNYASSETSNDGYENRAPGVVARLMGLDSLPSSSVMDQNSTSSDGFRPLKVSRDSLQDSYGLIDNVGCSRQLTGFPSTLVEAKVRRVHNRPIERFQSEVLPPKSAKPISASHHKLFSPIRSPGNFPAKNPEYIIEAAAKILEANPRVMRGRVKSSISASVPLRIQDLKAKLEAAYEASKQQTLHEPISGINVGRKPVDKDYCGLEDSLDSQTSVPLRNGNTVSGRYIGKSPMNVKDAKVGVQRREEKSQIAPRNVGKSGERNEGNSNRISRRQPSLQRTSPRKVSMNKRAMVLQQNNQKQNLVRSGPYLTSKGSGSNQQSLRAHFAHGDKNVNKANAKYEHNSMKKSPSNTRNNYSSFRVNPLSLNKGASTMDSQRMRSVSTNILVSNDAVARSTNDNKKGMDVISFTFNSPIKKISRDLLSDEQDCPDTASNVDNCKPSLRGSTSSSPSQNVINGNSLSILLERKLRELTSRIQSSDFETAAPESLCSSNRCPEKTVSSVVAQGISADHKKGIQEIPDAIFSFVCSSAEALASDKKRMENVDGSRDMEGVSSNTTSSAGKEIDFQQPSPVSILETSFESRSPDGISTNDDSKDCSSSSPQDQEMFKWLCTKEFLAPDDESEFSNSSRSSFSVDLDSKLAASYSMCSNSSRNWELVFIGDIVGNVGWILAEILLTPRKETERPAQFEELEDWINATLKYEDKPKDRRKLLFDCATECVESRCRHVFTGTNRSWSECNRIFETKPWLAEEVYREITSRKSRGDVLVDELVDADMSSRNGKWIEFNAEMFEEGVKIGKGILGSLIDELVTDLCRGKSL